MHNHDDKYPSRPGFEPSTSSFETPVDTNEPSGPASILEICIVLTLESNVPMLHIDVSQKYILMFSKNRLSFVEMFLHVIWW